MIVAVLVACTEPTTVDSGAAEADDDASGANYFSSDALEPVFEAEDVELALTTATTRGMIWPMDLHAWFEGLMDEIQLKEGDCPTRQPSREDPDVWTSYWGGTCTSVDHTVYGDWIAYVTRTTGAEKSVLIASELWSFTGSVNETGAPMYAGGNAQLHWEATANSANFEVFYGGAYLDPLAEGPLQNGVDGGLTIRGTYDHEVGFNGELVGGVMGGGAAIDFRNVLFNQGLPSEGVIGVRDPSSGWWTITLGQDGCGDLEFGEVYAGTTCAALDIGPVLAGRIADSLENPP